MLLWLLLILCFLREGSLANTQAGLANGAQRLKPENSQAESTAFARLAAYIVK